MPTNKHFSVSYNGLPPSVQRAIDEVVEHHRLLKIRTAIHIPIALFIITIPFLLLKFESHNESFRKEYIRLFRALRQNINNPKIKKLIEHKDAEFVVVNPDKSLGVRKVKPKLSRPPFGYIPFPNPKNRAAGRDWRKRKLVKRR